MCSAVLSVNPFDRDEDTRLPQEILDRIPFPQEDGIPRFNHRNDPNFVIEVQPLK
jgi:hypothetical protein